ncbi:MAG TPA: CRTAC1 family protein [Planctomycetaceae bacterium]|nr:CRTAC1 family protein [Planctomycetaceae bacterium]
MHRLVTVSQGKFWLILTVAISVGCGNGQQPERVEFAAETAPEGLSSDSGLLADLNLRPETASNQPVVSSQIRFENVHVEAGLDFTFDNGFSPARLMPHSTSGGAGWLDYDGDGWLDLFLPQGGSLTANDWTDQPRDQLYRNVAGRFELVTIPAQIVDAYYGHGLAVGDYNGDGFDDIYVTNVGPDVLHLNMGDGTFREVSRQAGIANPEWSSSAAWGDLDRDGDLDLYVCNYLDYDPKHPIACLDEAGNPSTCNPTMVSGVPNHFYLNQGDGTFIECADDRGLNAPGNKSLGVVIADFNEDGEPDVFVANDTTANQLFMNQGGGRFVENAVALGCALSGLGQFQAGMGVAYGDYDHNGYPDLYITHFTAESNTLYQNFGGTGFIDVTSSGGLHLPTLPYLGFGTVMVDFDANGYQDLIVANGHIDDYRKRTGVMWYMRPQLFTFDGRTWHECTTEGGPYFEREWLGRAVASADYDRDGDLDLAVIHQNDPIGLLRNDSPSGHSLRLRFIGSDCNRRGIGVKVVLKQADRQFVQQLPGGTSYCASHEPVLHFGLGASTTPCELAVVWPGGKRETLSAVAVDQDLVIREASAQLP